KAAKRMVEKERPEVWDILEQVIREHPVLLNRAPTLHRLGIQAFEPTLVEGKAIQLHPLVCAAFNADFDGDQMAVHVPLSMEAQLEARVLMMSTNNILSPANGKPIIVPSQDIILGLYFMSLALPNQPGDGMVFFGMAELEHALHSGAVSLHSNIKCRLEWVDEKGDPETLIVDSTPGRMLLSEILPRHTKIKFDLINKLLTKKEISHVIDEVYRHCGSKQTVLFADRIMGLGYYHACRAGISFGKDDMVIPPAKEKLVNETRILVKGYEKQFQDGLITQGEKYNKVVDVWAQCTDKVADEMMKGISGEGSEQTVTGLNSVFMMADSGARGSAAQMKQLAGMRGLMAKPSGEIIETPIISNFKEGLSVLEYFNSTHGARKGLADTALKTANSGYLTRRLVDVAQDCIITEYDCGTKKGLKVSAVIEGSNIVSPLSERILGRYASVDVMAPGSRKKLVKAGEMMEENIVDVIDEAGVDEIMIRSVLTCDTEQGVCGKCYGRDLARGTPVNIGEAVGVIAAQSIGEPGTQLTMRTFHIGGTAQRGAEQSDVEAAFDAKVVIRNRNVVIDSKGRPVVMGRNCEVVLTDENDRERARYRVPYGTRLLHDDGDQVSQGDRIAEWDPYTLPIITESEGIANYVDMIEGVSYREIVDETTGIANKVVIDWKQQAQGADLRPRITLRDENDKVLILPNGSEARYFMSVDAILNIADGAPVHGGDVLARIPRESSKTRDITGGLPRVAELFEARKPKDFAIIAEAPGRVEYGKDYKAKRRIIVHPDDESAEPIEYLFPKGKYISVQEGDHVDRGDLLMDGSPVPHDILKVLGVEALANYLIDEIQEVYRLQGVKINDKHIEVICRQMLQKIEIKEPGETTYLVGEQIDRREFEAHNVKIVADGRKPAIGFPVLQGITKASLQTSSFISAASFQETTRVLTEAAIAGRSDKLVGLKENVIVGRLIPAGTGSLMARFKELAAKRDEEYEELAAKQEAEAQAVIAAAAAADAEAANEGEVAEEAQLG
ncbi:MAG: DNA-directed RNA polymerase subunit beta', partial [Gammaproteobacteria bacterium]|nr:DNA-directed RNA polymerase subunit beta' [Gammaproteobacteria bacterium]